MFQSLCDFPDLVFHTVCISLLKFHCHRCIFLTSMAKKSVFFSVFMCIKITTVHDTIKMLEKKSSWKSVSYICYLCVSSAGSQLTKLLSNYFGSEEIKLADEP